MAFDIGGTWFRSGLVGSEGRWVSVSRRPAVSFKSHPHLSVLRLQQALVDYLVGEVRRLGTKRRGGRPCLAGISMGAALDGRTGYLWSSGPLWGPESRPFDLAAALRTEAPEVHWVIVNDITAALMWHVTRSERLLEKTTLITVSSGIGCRSWDGRRRTIPLDPTCGLQGEIGHLPIPFLVGRKLVERTCDCGGPNHLNAFCSGSGISALLPLFAERLAEDYRGSSLADREPARLGFADLIGSARRQERFAHRVLELVTRPLAGLLLHQLTLEPEVDRIILTGGVVHGLAPYYMDSLLGNLERLGLYQISEREPRFFRQRLEVGQADDRSGLLGAALMASRAQGVEAPHVESAAGGRP